MDPQVHKTDVYVVLDLDRTLLDTTKLVLLVAQILNALGVSKVELAKIYAHIRQQDGNQFDYNVYMREVLGDETVNAMIDQLTKQLESGDIDASELFYDGVAETFDALDTAGIPYGIVTAGGEETQTLKLTLLRAVFKRNIPARIVASTGKAMLAQEGWYVPNQSEFIVPKDLSAGDSVVAQRIAVVDDKPENLVTDNKHIATYLIDNTRQVGKDTLTMVEFAKMVSEGKL